MKRLVWIVVIIMILIAVVLFFYPKERVVSGLRGGPVAPGETAYREDYTCVGIKYDFCPNWPDYGCDYLCFGMVSYRVCTLEEYDPLKGVLRNPIECRGHPSPEWGLPG
jgi:hypothetical protein